MIIVIVSAGIGVDWWDAHHGRPLPKPSEVIPGDDDAARRLMEENTRLKTENALLSLQNDELHKQVEELRQKPADATKTAAEPSRPEPGKTQLD